MIIISRINTLLLLFILLAFSAEQTQSLKIICIGDSITQGPGREDERSWPLVMAKHLGNQHQVINLGVSSRTMMKTGDYPYWNEPQWTQALNSSCDWAIIQLGTNDAKTYQWNDKQFISDYFDMITALQSLPSHPLV